MEWVGLVSLLGVVVVGYRGSLKWAFRTCVYELVDVPCNIAVPSQHSSLVLSVVVLVQSGSQSCLFTSLHLSSEREFFIDNLLVRIHRDASAHQPSTTHPARRWRNS